METYQNLNKFFEEVLSGLHCRPDTRAYIVSIFSKYRNSEFDLSKDSLTTTFSHARETQDFASFQNLGDWIFFSRTFAQGHLRFASEDYYRTLAQLSYYSCYRLIKCQWILFEELADNFEKIEKEARSIILHI